MSNSILRMTGSAGRILLDGASGTQMQSLGMPPGICPEKYALEHPDVLAGLHRSYYSAGSDIVMAFTFGGNETKLSHFGIGPEESYDINKSLAGLLCRVRDLFSAEVPGRTLLAAGDIGPTGRFLEPAGDMSFAEMRDIYSRQAKALEDGGVDVFAVETMMDLLQVKAAVAGIRQVSSLPVMVMLTFDKGRTLSGNTPEACLTSLSAMGVDAIGANCSTGPEGMTEIIEKLAGLTEIPVIAKPNAGMPEVIEGITVFPMGAEEFAAITADLFAAGATVIGGCCGTSPLHIRKLREELDKRGSSVRNEAFCHPGESYQEDCISSYRTSVRLSGEVNSVTVKPGSPEDIGDLIMDASDEGADHVVIDLRDIESGGSRIKEIRDQFAVTAMTSAVPLGVLCYKAELLEALAQVYPGRLHFSGTADADIEDIAGRYGVKVV